MSTKFDCTIENTRKMLKLWLHIFCFKETEKVMQRKVKKIIPELWTVSVGAVEGEEVAHIQIYQSVKFF